MPASLPANSRAAEVRRLSDEMDRAAALSEGQFSAYGMLVTDASLAGDADALHAAQDGLQWLYRRYAGLRSPRGDELEHRGRLLGLIDTTHWALRRLPSTLQLGLDPAGHAARFLIEVARHPGLSNQELASRLSVDETEVSRVGRRLLSADVVWRRRQWRRNVWDVTPRGRRYLESAGLLAGLVPASAASAAATAPLAYAVGVKVLPRLLVGVVTDADAQVLTELRRPLPGPLAVHEAGAELAGFTRELLDLVPEITPDARPDPAWRDRVGVGVEITGQVSPDGTVRYAPGYAPHGDWAGWPVAAELGRALGLPVVVDNDANALAEFEHAFGTLAGVGSSATLVLDEAVGCGIVAEGHLVHGADGSAGEIGHLVVQPQGRRCYCGARGCLDTVASTVAITERITDRAGVKVADLAAAAALVDSGDAAAVDTVRLAGRAVGHGLAAVLNLVNPEQVMLYAPPELVDEPAYASARCFMTGLRKSAKERSFFPTGRPRLLVKEHQHLAGARAAAVLPLVRRPQ